MPPKQLRRRHRGAAITVSYDIARCIHAAECTMGLPAVFNRNRSNWIDPDGAAPDRTLQVILRCPTGALRAESPEGSDLEAARQQNSIWVMPGGPLYLRGNLSIRTREGDLLHRDTRMALCRCGASDNKPFCDNSHLRIEFRDEQPTPGSRAPDIGVGELTIVPKRGGPFELIGPVTIRGDAEEVLFRGERTRLCRCGASREKPFCDDSHHEFEFEAEVW